MCGRVWEREATESRADGPFVFKFSWHFSDCSPSFLSHCFFLSSRDWEFSAAVSFSCHTSLFACARARAFLFCSGWLLDFPAPFPSSQYVIPLEKYTCMTSGDCRVIFSSHAQFDEMKVPHWRSYVKIQASDGCKSAFEAAPLLDGSKPAADRSSHVQLALPCELTRKNRHVHAGLPRRRTTTRSPTVRLNSKLSKATLTSRTEKIRRQNIRLNSCSLTLKERSDSDDMVRKKSSKKQQKSLAGDGRDADVVSKFAIEQQVCGPREPCVGMLRYSMATTRKVKGRVLTTWSEEESLPCNVVDRHSFGKNRARNIGQFWNLAEYFWTFNASFNRKIED